MNPIDRRSALRRLAGAVCIACGAPLAALAAPEDEKLCGTCHTTGKIPHPPDPDLVKKEGIVVRCTEFMEKDKDALGLDWMPCPKCVGSTQQKAAAAEFAKRFDTEKQWIEGRRQEVDANVHHECLHLQTPHFTIAWDIPEIEVKKVVYRRHEAAHLYAQRFEDLYAEFQRVLGVTDADTNHAVHRLYIFESMKSAIAESPHVTGLAFGQTEHCYKIDAAKTWLVFYWNKQKFGTDELLHEYLTHLVVHLISHDVGTYTYWMFERYGWVMEGLSHWFEVRKFGPPVAYCIKEADPMTNFRGKGWERIVKLAVLANDYPAFQDVLSKGVNELDGREHVFSWSWVDYLMWLDAKKMKGLLVAMKGDKLPTREALQKSYGLTIGQFIDGWLAFVKEQYSVQPYVGARVRAPKGAR